MRGARSYSSTSDERSPLLQFNGSFNGQSAHAIDHHVQFCKLVGVTPYALPAGQEYKAHPQSLYVRAVQRRDNQYFLYILTATLINGLLLSQVVLGASLTALAASNSSRVLITVFGAANTVIAGIIAFLKSRGQPLRARMFRDDLDRVVDEIESSAVMWLGISSGMHGYDAIDTDEQVTVRSEVARLTRLYDRAVKANTTNDPDLYAAGGPGDFHHAALRTRPGQPAIPPMAPQPVIPPAPAPVVQAPVVEPADESPATKAPTPTASPKPAEEPKPVTGNAEGSAPETGSHPSDTAKEVPVSVENDSAMPSPQTEQSTVNGDKSLESSAPATPATEHPDPDASPATAAHFPAKEQAPSEKSNKPTRLDELRKSGSDAQALSPFFNI
ncbi:hypothetical protein Q7P37_002896 [Cladosporium fusiforme]